MFTICKTLLSFDSFPFLYISKFTSHIYTIDTPEYGTLILTGISNPLPLGKNSKTGEQESGGTVKREFICMWLFYGTSQRNGTPPFNFFLLPLPPLGILRAPGALGFSVLRSAPGFRPLPDGERTAIHTAICTGVFVVRGTGTGTYSPIWLRNGFILGFLFREVGLYSLECFRGL